MKFSQAFAAGSPFRPREFIAGKDAVTLARDILARDHEGFRAAFRKSPMKPAKLRGLQRNARVVLENSPERQLPRISPTILQRVPTLHSSRSRKHACTCLWRIRTGRRSDLTPRLALMKGAPEAYPARYPSISRESPTKRDGVTWPPSASRVLKKHFRGENQIARAPHSTQERLSMSR